jgi:hypothetical protein
VPAYFVTLLGSTLAALFLLALAGAWSLWAFRDRNRPYLLLAAPLAGIATLSLSLSVLYVVCRLSVPISFLVALLVNGAATLAVCRRGAGDLLPRRRRDAFLSLAALLGVAAGSVWVVQGTALGQREPTILLAAGSDMFGYSHMGDWMLRHPHEMPVASPERPYESFLEILVNYDTRHGAFLLAAVTAWCRGTTTLFSLDFATGVAWAAALLGFAAAFARRPLLFLTLIAAAAMSVWLRNARAGYFGKTLAYPGCLLLAHVLIQTWRTSTPLRLASCLVLGWGFGLCHTPSLLAGAVGLVCMGIALVRGLSWILDRAGRRQPSDLQPETGPLWKGLMLAAALTLPLGIIFSAHLVSVSKQTVDAFAAPSDLVFAESLDLGTLWDPAAVTEQGRQYLIGAALAFALVCFAIAVAVRALTAAGLILSSAVPLACWCTGKIWSVYQTQGLIYPLTLAGAALLLQQAAVRRSRWLRLAAVCLVLGLAGVRLPQFHRTVQVCSHCIRKTTPFIAQSQVAAVLDHVGTGTVDVCHFDGRVCLTLLLELGARGIPCQFREPAWTTILAYRRWHVPEYAACGSYLVSPWTERSPAAESSVRVPLAVTPNEGAWIGELTTPNGVGRDGEHGYHFWLGSRPASAVLSNGTGGNVVVEFVATAEVHPVPGDSVRRTLVWCLDGKEGRVEVASTKTRIRIPFLLPPGDHTLKLGVEQLAAPGPTLSNDARELRLLIGRFSLQRRVEETAERSNEPTADH